MRQRRPFTTLLLVGLSLPLTWSYQLDTRQEDGLKIDKTKEVKCDRKSTEGDIISVHYKGTLAQDGTKFDSSYDRDEPLEFELGDGKVIKGWDQGLLDMCVGEERKLTVPPALAYGPRKNGPIPPGSTLVFETKLVGIKGEDSEDGSEEDSTSSSHSQDDAKLSATTTQPEPTTKATQNAKSTDAAETVQTEHGAEATATESDKPAATSSAEYSESTHSTEKVDHSDPSQTMPGKIEEKPDHAIPALDPTGPNQGVGEGDGECHLLGPFALIVQGALGILALFSLVWKRWRETPRRPIKVWFFDVSKQVVGSVLLHILNLLMSTLSSTDLEVARKAKEVASHFYSKDGSAINPCSFYLVNIAIDTTVGVFVLFVLLKILHGLARRTPLAKPLESVKSGHYGQPPRTTWWLKQSFIYFIGLVLMKLCVFFLFQILPWISLVGDWALKWTEGNQMLQIVFVMLVFPLVMNAIQYYIIDSFIKEKDVDYSAYRDDSGARYQTLDGYDSDDDAVLTSEVRPKAPKSPLDGDSTHSSGSNGRKDVNKTD